MSEGSDFFHVFEVAVTSQSMECVYLVNTISQELLEEINPNLVQMFVWTYG